MHLICTFSARTDTLAETLRCNVEDLADVLGISRRTLFNCRKSDSNVTPKTLGKLEKAESEAGINKEEAQPEYLQFSDRCESLCAALRLTNGQLAQRLGINRQHLSALMHGKAPITQASWKKLEELEASLESKKTGVNDSEYLADMVAEAQAPYKPGKEAFEAYRGVIREFRDIALLRYPDHSEKQAIEIERLMLLLAMMKGDPEAKMERIKELEKWLKE